LLKFKYIYWRFEMTNKPQNIIIFSGAGLSAESGLSTFRDSDGLWANYDINEVCNYNTWIDNFGLVHEFYSKRRVELGAVSPNEAHRAIARIQQKYGTEQVSVITQNVDDLLERAGCENVIHVHGELTKLRCMSCNHIWDVGYSEYAVGTKCPHCAGVMIKPFVVFFNENAPMYKMMYERFEAICENDIVVIIGTSGNVVSLDALLMGSKKTGYKILNNLEPSTQINEKLFDKIFYEPCTTAMPKVEELIQILTQHDYRLQPK
jgi:NAD-dependent deacetylase